MIAKTLEIRDAGTFIPMLAVKLSPDSEPERYLLSRAGYGPDPETQSGYVQLIRINGGKGEGTCDPYDWGGIARTMKVAHDYIIKNFDSLESGAVVCVETILGERETPKRSERLE